MKSTGMLCRSVVAIVLCLLVAGCWGCRGDGREASPDGLIIAPPPPPTPPGGVSFVAFGDWGDGGEGQKSVAASIGKYCRPSPGRPSPCEFILTLGDNFYGDGVGDLNDPLWKRYYKDIYGPLGIPFYAALGNHDMKGNPQAQIDYSKIDTTWHMPAENYSLSLPEGRPPPTVDLFIFNSDRFDGAAKGWLQSALSSSRAVWKILAMHHPIYSNGAHGDDDKGINKDLLPIVCGKVDLVLSGHDHNFAHLRSGQDGCPVEQLVIGTGGVSLRKVDKKDPRVLSTGSFYGFGWFQVSPEEVLFRMVDAAGNLYYTATWKK